MSEQQASEVLGQKLDLGHGVVLKNRIAKAAMSERLADRGGAPSERLIRLYERWGKSGAGMLITGNVMFDPRGRTELENVVIQDETSLPMLKRWADVAQADGAQLWMQISHAGRQAARQVTSRPLAPSPIALKGFGPLFAKPQPLTESEIEELIEGYARTALIAKKAGFSGVQIHGAHGYLVSQFLSPRSNQRTDRWGGSLENRMLFLLEIIRTTRELVGEEFPIAVKLNSADFQRGGFTPEESMEVAEALEKAGIAWLEVSGGNYESPSMTGLTDKDGNMRASTASREAYFLEYASEIRKRVSIPLMLTGGLRTASVMSQVIAEGHVDMVGLARPMALEPELPQRILDGEAESAMSVNPRVGIKMLDSMISLEWSLRQMRRMSVGLEPKPSLGAWSTALIGFLSTFPVHPKQFFWRIPRQSGKLNPSMNSSQATG
ncbi:MAG: NADH:flavin oxidoreductase/NADH oxidase family protein [Deltaproteobacteria bacterium]|nr:MAG: NADH:flavin oxidoreductase/NADH oxidase family protein [Deltaproteobacteria bacterium]